MKEKITLTFLLLLVGIFSVVTGGITYASTNTNDPKVEAEEAAEEGRTEGYDDNPDLDGDGTITQGSHLKLQGCLACRFFYLVSSIVLVVIS